MSLTLAYMALNPNLTTVQVSDLAARHLEAKASCWRRIEEATQKMPPPQALEYLSAVLPVMLIW